MNFGLQGKSCLVTGASKGLGRAVALGLAAERARVMISARDEESLKQTADHIQKETGVQVYFAACDLKQEGARNRLLQKAQEVLGDIDVLVHNAGGPPVTSALETRPEQWRDGFEQLFISLAHLAQAVVPGMQERRWGRVIVVTSLSVVEPIANLAVSNAIRSAATAFCKTLADEVAGYNVTVNCVAPGMILTDRTDELLKGRVSRSGKSEEEFMSEYLQSIPAGRLGAPEEFASAVVFLASDSASYITGSTLCVDGGKRRSTL